MNKLKTISDEAYKALIDCDTDIDGALFRFCNDENLYISSLLMFSKDPTISDLSIAINNKDWDTAFTAAHALKGLAGNMGFIPLYHYSGELVLAIRTGRVLEIGGILENIKKTYKNITIITNNILGESP